MNYIIEGPESIGNMFGYYGCGVPAGQFAIVHDGEYANGGHGPIQSVKGLYDSREAAQARLDVLTLADCTWKDD